MDHIAIMTPSWHLIPKILTGEKSIESRWYQTRRAPWNTIHVGDTVFFKDSGKAVTAKATVAQVHQFTVQASAEAESIVKKFGDRIRLVNPDVQSWPKLPKYAILIELTDPKAITPFTINKAGFGAGVAWISVENIALCKNSLTKIL